MTDLYDELNIAQATHEHEQRLLDEEDAAAGTTKLDLFRDYIQAILKTDRTFPHYNGYAPPVVNRYLSYDSSMVMFANLMNCHPLLDNETQFEFLRHSISKSQRYIKWIKQTKDDRIKVIMAVYKYSYEKAKDVVDIITPEQFKVLEQSLYKGGTK